MVGYVPGVRGREIRIFKLTTDSNGSIPGLSWDEIESLSKTSLFAEKSWKWSNQAWQIPAEAIDFLYKLGNAGVSFFGALERLYEALERTMQSARLCLSKQTIIDILDREVKEPGGAKEWISKKKEDLDQLEITYDKLKKEFEDVRERNEIETHREYF